MSPKEYYELIQEIKSSVEGIGRAWLVVDDSQLGNTLEAKSKEDNAFLIGVLPSYGASGDYDAIRETLLSQLLVVEKVDYSELTEEDFVQVFERTYRLALMVRDFLIQKLGSGCYSYVGFLDIDDLEIVPVWKKSQCNGWSIEFSLG